MKIKRASMIFVSYFNDESVTYGDPYVGYEYVTFEIKGNCLYIQEFGEDDYPGDVGMVYLSNPNLSRITIRYEDKENNNEEN